MISIILPSYNEENNIFFALSEIKAVLEPNNIDFEIIFVNDGSKDETWNNILKANEIDSRVRGVSFSRNFGKESAIFAGLEACSGDCAVVMDCDMQHPAKSIPKMYELWKNGYEVVEGIKSERGHEGMMHKIFVSLFYMIQSKLSGLDMNASSDFKLIDRKVIDILVNLPERNTFFRALSFWAGFKRTEIKYEVLERKNGTSKWSKKSLCKYAVNNITDFSAAPMLISFWSGLILFILGLAYGIFMIVNICSSNCVGKLDVIILLILSLSGLLMMFLGIVGYYIGKVYYEIKGRPRYIISSRI